LDNKGLDRAARLVHTLIGEVLTLGGVAIDATAGNGHDTLFLARQVGSGGLVYAFDIQQQALLTTSERLVAHGLDKQVILLQHSHEEMAQWVTVTVDAVIFNLGYLPGGKHDLVTKPESTLAALGAAILLLRPGGRIGIVIYTGHSGALKELDAVEMFAKSLDPTLFNTIRITNLNRSARAPVVIFVEKAGDVG